MDKKVQNEIKTIIKKEILPIVTKDVVVQKVMSSNLVLIIKIDNATSYFIPFDEACPISSMMFSSNKGMDSLRSLVHQNYFPNWNEKSMVRSFKNVTNELFEDFNTFTDEMLNKKISFDRIYFLKENELLSSQEYYRKL